MACQSHSNSVRADCLPPPRSSMSVEFQLVGSAATSDRRSPADITWGVKVTYLLICLIFWGTGVVTPRGPDGRPPLRISKARLAAAAKAPPTT